MMQRKDLAKEFSLLVQQEIKNHNDLILASNSSLEEFRRNLSDMSINTEKKISALAAYHISSKSELKRVELETQEQFKKIASQITDLKMLIDKGFREINQLAKKRETYFLTISGFQEFQEKLSQWMAHIKSCFAKQRDFTLDEVKKISLDFSKNIDCYKDSIKKEFSEIQETNKDFNKTLDVFGSNFSGFVREAEILKNRCFVIEKNIENIYTQLQRLKDK